MPDDTTRQTDLTPSTTTNTKAIASLAIVMALLMPTDVLAQSRTFYGADGRVTGRTSTSGNQTTIYGSDGRRVGTVTTTRPQGR